MILHRLRVRLCVPLSLHLSLCSAEHLSLCIARFPEQPEPPVENTLTDQILKSVFLLILFGMPHEVFAAFLPILGLPLPQICVSQGPSVKPVLAAPILLCQVLKTRTSFAPDQLTIIQSLFPFT